MKKLLFAACAVFSIASLQARHVTIDNDMDGKQATDVQATVYFTNGTSQTINVSSGTERRVRFPEGTHAVSVMVQATGGAGAGQVGSYAIPPQLINRRIKVDIDLKRGQLKLSHDRR